MYLLMVVKGGRGNSPPPYPCVLELLFMIFYLVHALYSGLSSMCVICHSVCVASTCSRFSPSSTCAWVCFGTGKTMGSTALFQVVGAPGGEVSIPLSSFDLQGLCAGPPAAAVVVGTVDGGAVWALRSFAFIRPIGLSVHVVNETCVKKALENLTVHHRFLRGIVGPVHLNLEPQVDQLFLKQRQGILRLFARIRLAKIHALHGVIVISPEEHEEAQGQGDAAGADVGADADAGAGPKGVAAAADDADAADPMETGTAPDLAYSPGSHSNPDRGGVSEDLPDDASDPTSADPTDWRNPPHDEVEDDLEEDQRLLPDLS